MSEATAVGYFIAALGVGLLVGVGGLLAIARKSLDWPATKGVVVAYGLDTSGRGYLSTAYRPRIEYSFDVGGQSYTGTRIQFGDSLWGWTRQDNWLADRALSTYSAGQEVTVFHHPRWPGICTLTRLEGLRPFVELLVAAAVFVAVGVGAAQGLIAVR